MTEPIHAISDPYIVNLLNISCKGPATVEGYSTYRVETHCTAVTYTAKPLDRDHDGMPTRYSIIHRDYEAC